MRLRSTRLTAIAHAARRVVAGYSPAGLFSAGEQGVWYDPSDMSTMFQDAAGTTPVTAVEQPVGRILDKSGRGNHATQTTATSRPVLSARVNLLTATETLATQTVTTRATTQTLRFEGAGTVTLSGTATGTYSAGSHSVTTTAGNLTLTVSGTVTKADLRAANMGVGLPAYQRVNTATDYDTAGFPHYLRFDGVDDWLVTPTITPGIDKVQVFAGVRKQINYIGSEFGILLEFSPNVDSGANSGVFRIIANGTSGFDLGYNFDSRGTFQAAANLSFTQSPAPQTLISSGLGDISGDSAILRVNGAQAASSTADQGQGNYLAYPLYIGRRLGTTLLFNGNLYGLIVRFGANLQTATIASTETWLNGKTRAYA